MGELPTMRAMANDWASLRAAAKVELELPRDLRPKNAYNLIRLLDLAIRELGGETPDVRGSDALRSTLVAIKRGEVPMTEAVCSLDENAVPDVLAQVQAEAASTWQTPSGASAPVRGAERLRAWCEGFSLHAGVVIAEHDRDALERLCRYGARPAFALERLTWTDDGRISYKLKRPWPDGRTHLVMEPVAFLRRLVGIIPPPRRHLVRYSGVFGPASKQRAKLRALVPTVASDAEPGTACGTGSGASSTGSEPSSRSRRPPWAELLRRVFADDVLQCPCGGRRSVIAIVTDSVVANTLLTALGLSGEPVTFAPARSPPQAELAWDEAS